MEDIQSIRTICPSCKIAYTGIYTELPSQDIDFLFPHQICTEHKKGSSFFHEGSRPNGVFFIHKGKVKIYKHGDGREQIIKIAKEGELLGYRAILADERFPVSAKALEDCRLCFIPREVFLKAIHSSSIFSQKILKEACGELDMMTGVLTNMAQKTVIERIVHTLIQLQEIYKDAPITLKREDLAGLVGTATETLIRFLSDMKKLQLISIQGRKITILDISGLKKYGKVL